MQTGLNGREFAWRRCHCLWSQSFWRGWKVKSGPLHCQLLLRVPPCSIIKAFHLQFSDPGIPWDAMEEERVSRTSPRPQGVNDLVWGWPAYWEYILFHHSSYSLWKFLLSSNSKCLMVLLRRHLLQDFHILSNHSFPSYIHSYDHKRYKHECSISRTVSISLCFYDVGETLIGGIHLDIMLA